MTPRYLVEMYYRPRRPDGSAKPIPYPFEVDEVEAGIRHLMGVEKFTRQEAEAHVREILNGR